jgi:hypothetical protein
MRLPLHAERIGVRFAPEHRARAEAAAQARRMSLSEFCREAIIRASQDPDPGPTLPARRTRPGGRPDPG